MRGRLGASWARGANCFVAVLMPSVSVESSAEPSCAAAGGAVPRVWPLLCVWWVVCALSVGRGRRCPLPGRERGAAPGMPAVKEE